MVSPQDPDEPYIDPDDYTSEHVASATFAADLGPQRSLGTVAEVVQDMATLVNLGERVALRIASEARRDRLRTEKVADAYLSSEARSLGVEETDVYRTLPRAHALDLLADLEALPEAAYPVWVVSVRYRNPLEIVIGGVVFVLIRGLVPFLRLVRDWSHTRRLGEARAQAAHSEARITSTRADLIEWLARETREGRNYVPLRTLVDMVSDSDLKALDRLADYAVHIDVPSDSDSGDSGAGADRSPGSRAT